MYKILLLFFSNALTWQLLKLSCICDVIHRTAVYICYDTTNTEIVL